MQLNLRQAIVHRVIDKPKEELMDIIQSSIGSEERSLPGLGVLFEMIWQDCDQKTKDQLADSLQQHLEANFQAQVDTKL